MSGVKHAAIDAPEDGYHEAAHEWAAQLAVEVSTLDSIFDELLRLLSPEKAQADTPLDELF